MADAMRTPSGAPSQKAREKTGGEHGEFPVFDHKSAHSALMLRGHADNPSKIIAKVRRWATEHNDKAILAECDSAAEKDRGKMDDSEDRSDSLAAATVETRSANVAVDGVDFGQRIITVLAVPYESETQVPFNRDVWGEVFTRSAFNGIETRQSRIPVTAAFDVPATDHKGGRLVGRVIRADSTGEQGLITDVKVSRTALGDEALELANDDALSASVGFMVKDPNRDQQIDRRAKKRRITRAFLHHLAFVGDPAYEGTKVLGMRSTFIPESEQEVLASTPVMDRFLDDPILQWALRRVAG